MTLGDALRRVARAIAHLQTPEERAITSANIQNMIRNPHSDLWLSLEQAAACFYPSDEAKANQVFAILKQAKAARQLGDPRIGEFINVGHLDTWPQRPTFGDDSPLRYWFGNALASVVSVPNDESIDGRNDRWLAKLEVAQKGTNPPSSAAVFREIAAGEGNQFETIKKGVAKAKKDLAAKYAEGNVKPLARGKKGKPDPLNVWAHHIKK